MQRTRRQYLRASASACFVPALAGCTEGTTVRRNTEPSEHEPSDTRCDGCQPGGTITEPSEPNPVVEILESDIITDGEGTKWIRMEVRNTTESDHGRLRVNHSVYDDNDEVVDSQEALIDLLPAGETWRDYLTVLGDRREEAASVQSEILTNDGSLSSFEIESIEIVDSTLNQDYRSGTEIVGEIRSRETEYSQVYLVGLVYTDEAILRGSVGEIINDLGSGATRSFRAAIASNRTPPDREKSLPTQHDLYVFDGIP